MFGHQVLYVGPAAVRGPMNASNVNPNVNQLNSNLFQSLTVPKNKQKEIKTDERKRLDMCHNDNQMFFFLAEILEMIKTCFLLFLLKLVFC